MERLTDRDPEVKCSPKYCNPSLEDCHNHFHKMREKLAAYEDLEYEPEELKRKLRKYELALKKISTRKMSQYLNVSSMNRDFILTANQALGTLNEQ